MTQALDIPPGRDCHAGGARRLGRWAALAVLCGLLAACSLGNDEEEAAETSGAAYAQDSPYPNLASVPGEAPQPTSEGLRDNLVKGLVADSQNARYTDEALTADSAAVPPAPSPPTGRPRVDITWETPRALTEDQVAEGTQEGERVEVEWETARVEPGEAEPLEGAEIDLPAIKEGGTELLAVIRFPTDATDLNDADRALLRDVLVRQKEQGGLLHLVSHGAASGEADDPVTQRLVDLDLSLKRANAVATTLLDLGASQDKLLVEAKSEAIPAADEAGDRKVEIFLEY
jgi:outer membrane protein OmpA-like peptidoglycan-associated protein